MFIYLNDKKKIDSYLQLIINQRRNLPVKNKSYNKKKNIIQNCSQKVLLSKSHLNNISNLKTKKNQKVSLKTDLKNNKNKFLHKEIKKTPPSNVNNINNIFKFKSNKKTVSTSIGHINRTNAINKLKDSKKIVEKNNNNNLNKKKNEPPKKTNKKQNLKSSINSKYSRSLLNSRNILIISKNVNFKPNLVSSKKIFFKKKNSSSVSKSSSKNISVNKKNKIKNTNMKNMKNTNNFYYRNLNDQELNGLEYNKAVQLDKRTYMQYYWALVKKKQLILFAFLPANDYNLFSLKLSYLILSFSLYFSVNGFFFTDSTMHNIHVGSSSIFVRLPQILYSSVISSVVNMLIKNLALSENSFLKLKNSPNFKKDIASFKTKLLIKFTIFFILSICLMLFFWYFIGCFCAVFENTQLILIKDTLVSFVTSMLYPFGINLAPGLFRIPSLKDKRKSKKCMYVLGNFLSLI